MLKIDLSQILNDPLSLHRNLDAWCAMAGLTAPVSYELDGKSTDNAPFGILSALANQPLPPHGRVNRLCWVIPYLATLGENIPIHLIEHPLEAELRGRGTANIWESVNTTALATGESGMRYSLHGLIDATPPKIRSAIGCGWAQAVLADGNHIGKQCTKDYEMFARRMLELIGDEMHSPDFRALVWLPMLECILLNLVMRFVRPFHEPQRMSLREQLIMRQVDMGSYSEFYISAFYAGFMDEADLDDWSVGLGFLHDVWQIEHDEKKPDGNMNSCHLMLGSGVTIRELSDYLTYYVCSNAVPEALTRTAYCFAVLTLSSARHKTVIPDNLPRWKHGPEWDVENVLKVRRIIDHTQSTTLARQDPTLSCGELDQPGMYHLLDPVRNLTHGDCAQNTDRAVRTFREWVTRYDVFPWFLSRSKYARDCLTPGPDPVRA